MFQSELFFVSSCQNWFWESKIKVRIQVGKCGASFPCRQTNQTHKGADVASSQNIPNNELQANCPLRPTKRPPHGKVNLTFLISPTPHRHLGSPGDVDTSPSPSLSHRAHLKTDSGAVTRHFPQRQQLCLINGHCAAFLDCPHPFL